jgi:hypothetical protein
LCGQAPDVDAVVVDAAGADLARRWTICDVLAPDTDTLIRHLAMAVPVTADTVTGRGNGTHRGTEKA